MAGWVRLYRKSSKSQVWQNAELWKTWCWCMIRANHTDRLVTVRTGRGTSEVPVKRGQFIYGRKAASKALSAAPSSVRARMEKLSKLKNIVLQPNSHYTLVTICNFNSYQDRLTGNRTGKPSPNGQATDRQPDRQHDTDKNVSKECLSKKGGFRPPSVPEVATYCTDRSNSVDATAFVDFYTARGWKLTKGVPMKDWRAAVRYWERNGYQNQAKQGSLKPVAELQKTWRP